MSSDGQGQQDLSGDTNDFNVTQFLISQALALVAGSTLVQVKAVSTNDAVAVIGTVDVLPLINMVDGAGVASKHDIIYGLPYCRVQAGKNAIICDPDVNDIGIAVFADRDISVVKKTQKQSNPGTFRKHNMSDGIYLFTVLSKQVPVQYVRFVQDNDGNPTGMEIVDVNANKIVMAAAGITITDVNNNTIVMDTNGVTINGVLIDRSHNVSGIVDITSTGNASWGGGAQFVKLASGANATKVKAT